MALILATASCEDSGGSGDVGPFLGTWLVLDGTAQANCGVVSPTSMLGGSQVKLTAGTAAPLVADVRGCLLNFDVTGRTANARPGQTCMHHLRSHGQRNVALDLTVDAASFALNNEQPPLARWRWPASPGSRFWAIPLARIKRTPPP